MEHEFERVFDSYEQLNKWEVFTGSRVNQSGTRPSVYISELKLKKAFKAIKDEHIEELYDKEMTPLGIARHRDKLTKKMEMLHPWQLFRAVGIFLDRGAYDAAGYVLLCRYTDRETVIDEIQD